VFTVSKSGDLSGIARELERGATQGQKDAGKLVASQGRKMILDDVRRARGSLRIMGGRLGVKSRVTASPATSIVELYGAPAGPWTIAEKGTKRHTIKPKRREVLAAGRGDVIGMSATHPGTRGGRYWTRAVGRLDDELGPLVERAVDSQMTKAGPGGR
jgi:hypothetical protein